MSPRQTAISVTGFPGEREGSKRLAGLHGTRRSRCAQHWTVPARAATKLGRCNERLGTDWIHWVCRGQS